FSQQKNWEIRYGSEKAFILNVGQFNNEVLGRYSTPEYAYDGSQEDYYFLKDGIVFRFTWLKEEEESERRELRERRKYTAAEWKQKEINEWRRRVQREFVSAKWLNANNDVILLPMNKTTFYYSYTFKKEGKLININEIPAYEKIIYKNIYNNIDVIYELPEKGGLKYSIVLRAGSDPMDIRLRYTDIRNISLKDNKVIIKTKAGQIIEHEPRAFYSDTREEVEVKYYLDEGTIMFSLGKYDKSREVIIDPWVQTPFSNSSNGVWECETDGNGNVYIIGDGMVDYQKLKKYNANGVLQWTYTTPWDTSGYWLGTLATDQAGNSYITAGSIAEIEKINTNGSMVYHKNGGPLDEYWAITFNCDQTKLIVGGTRLNSTFNITGDGVLFDINTNNGQVIDLVEVGAFRPGPLGLTNYAEEVRSIASAYNAKYYFITLDTIGAITQNFSQCPDNEPIFAINHGYHFSYKSENFRPETGNGANMMIKANRNFVYTMNGVKVDKRSLVTGQILQSVNIPGGSTQSSMGEYAPNNNGIDLDTCGNVYIGSTDRVIKYDANLNQITSSSTTYRVSDVAVGTNGAVIVCGTTGSSGSNNRVGYVASINFNACPKNVMVCCDANICAEGPFCPNDPPVNLTAGQPGGIWSGPGITNPNTGTFNPAVAGVGHHMIVYTLPCGSDSIYIDVLACTPLEVCYHQGNNNLQAEGGSGTITWQNMQTTIITPTNQQQCQQCGGQWIFNFCTVPVCSTSVWTSYATGYTANLPSSWPLLVTDGSDTLIFNNQSQIPPCDTVCTTPTFTYNVTHVTCQGQNNGAISLTMTSPGNFTYQWSGPGGFTSTQQNISNLAAGTYNVTVTNNQQGTTCTATASIVVNPGSPNPTPTISGSTTFCTGSYTTLNAGTGYASYLWNTGATTQTITVNTPGPYSVTVTNSSGCSGSASVVVGVSSALSPQITGTLALCSGASTVLDAGPGYASYLWNTGETTQTITVQANNPGTYSVTVSDATGCTGTAQATVTVSSNPTPTITGDNIICAGNVGTLNAGSGYSSYLWSNNQTTQIIQVSTAGTYTVTVTNNAGCTGTASIQVSVVPSPNANAGTDQTICGFTTNLNAIPSTGIGTWTYNGPGQVTINNPNMPNSQVTVSNAGVYYFIWTENAGSGCIDADTVVITFNQQPTSNFTVSTINCMGQQATVVYTGNASPNANYLWNWGGASVFPGSGQGPHTISYNQPGTYTISLQVTENGCTSVLTTVQVVNPSGMITTIDKVDLKCYGQSTGAINLTVTGGTPPYNFLWNNGATSEDLINLPAGTYSVTVTDNNGCTVVNGVTLTQPQQLTMTVTPSQTICLGQSATLNVVATGGTPPYTYYWNNQPGGTTLIVSPTQTTSYTVFVTDANGCSTTPITTTVFVSGQVYAELTANPTVVCPGDLVVLTPVVWGGMGSPYTIYDQNGNVVTPPIYLYPNISGYYWIRAEDACGTSDTAGVYITVLDLPPADALADTLQGCVPLTVHFIEINPDNGQTYVWDFGDQSNLSLDKNPVHTYTSPGNYTVTLTVISPQGCKTVKVYPSLIHVWPRPEAKFTWMPQEVTEIYPEVLFINQTYLGSTFMWSFGDGDSSSLKNPSHMYPSAGTYEVVLVAYTDKGCTDTAKAILIVKKEYTFYVPTSFTPNNDGINDEFYVMGRNISPESFKLQIFDRWGNVVWETDKFFVEKDRSEAWDGRNKNGKLLPVGTYTWRVLFRDNLNHLHEEAGPVTIIR
ncbi:MAG: PKD domain-containing protein, partial [Bacteroidales bacterium]|nr:PKD domain-containing protein [Bacteroidales bacterium]